MRVLAGDIGGTHTRLLLADVTSGVVHVVVEAQYASGAFDGLASIIAAFLASHPRDPGIEAACFALAGPIVDTPAGQHAKITNLSWQVDATALAQTLDIPQILLINDFEAVGYGIDALTDDDLVALQPGAPRAQAPRVVLGAGTGLGVALLSWCGEGYTVVTGEGGHQDFAPRDAQQHALLQHLERKFGHVSYERVLSGPGLCDIHAFLRNRGAASESSELETATTADDPAAAISAAALAGRDAFAVAALDLFVDIYGAFAGNLALLTLARGGVFLAGGIAPKILPKLQDARFLRAFTDKGRFAPLLAEFPVRVVRNPRVGLLGAARVAWRSIAHMK
ncbi:MAG: glucokinase [Candidatus Muproteobacteria bacterium RBG_16_64_10]|uniref:Glucokinase n=1 Tax=Candidatus Muproteobacteria bacterium RBG_16_64_10 TaxID=1817757 RepID=A0A1F6SVN3_9PROT|nr:MAG: glucokinase [Candidatus Muproteobacteria bacterium RBG_16_64_10]